MALLITAAGAIDTDAASEAISTLRTIAKLASDGWAIHLQRNTHTHRWHIFLTRPVGHTASGNGDSIAEALTDALRHV